MMMTGDHGENGFERCAFLESQILLTLLLLASCSLRTRPSLAATCRTNTSADRSSASSPTVILKKSSFNKVVLPFYNIRPVREKVEVVKFRKTKTTKDLIKNQILGRAIQRRTDNKIRYLEYT